MWEVIWSDELKRLLLTTLGPPSLWPQIPQIEVRFEIFNEKCVYKKINKRLTKLNIQKDNKMLGNGRG